MKLRRALIASLVPGVVLALSLSGCGDLLGLKDLEAYPADGSADSSEDSSSDGTTADTMSPADGPGVDGHDATGPGDGGSGDGTPGADAPEDTSTPADSSMGHDSSTGPDSSTGVDSSTGMDSSTAQDSSTGPDSSCTTGSQTDPLNCGSCGHNCLQGGCSGGVCQPFVLASGVTAYDIVSANGSLYWVDQGYPSGSVWTCSIASCSPHTFVPSQSSPERITQLGGVLYWSNYGSGGSNDGSIASHALSGGTTTTVASAIWTPQGIATDGTYLFWAESYSQPPQSSGPQLVRYDFSSMATTYLLTGSNSAPTAVGVGGGQVYWTDEGTGAVAASTADVTPLVGSAIGSGQTSPIAVSVDSTYVYWVDFTSSGAVWQYTIQGGASQQISGTTPYLDPYPIAVASDAAHVYWVDKGASTMDGKLVGCSPASCTPDTIEGSLQKPESLAIDSSAVYFGTIGDNKLHMMVR